MHCFWKVIANLWTNGVIHRDVSIGNVMINPAADSSQKALLIDFDNAIIREDEDRERGEDKDLTASKGHLTVS